MLTVFADTAAAPAPTQGGFGATGMIIYIVAIIASFYFLLIRPQKKQEKKTREMLAALQVGDEVVSIGGIKGKIRKIKDDYVVIETGADKTPIEFEKSAIKTVLTIHE